MGSCAPGRAGRFALSSAQIRFFSLVRREVSRFMKIKRQTLGAPLLETFLYISEFGVTSLEDAYLALVGRKELSRAHIEADVP